MVDSKFAILIVDDEQDTREMLTSGLRRKGYMASSVVSGEEAIEEIKKNKYEIVILDIKLPGIDGIQALEEIKKLKPEIEAIMITGYSSIEAAIVSMKKNAYDYVEKPISIDKIVLIIEKALEKHRLMETVALYEISKAIFSTIEFDELLQIIVDLTMKVLRSDDAAVMLFNEEKKLYIAISYALDEQIAKETKLAVGERIAGWVAERCQPVILINGLKNDIRFQGIQGRENIKSALVVPLTKNNQVFGILTVNRISIVDNFNNGDLYKANIFASLVSLALDNANLYKELQKAKNQFIRSSEELKNNDAVVMSTFVELKKTNEELQFSQKQLMQSGKLAALGRLVSDMAHEVNNPLMVISGTAQLSLMESLTVKEIRDNFQTIVSECVRAKEIIDRLLRFSLPSKGEFKEVDINNVIKSIVSLVKHQFELTGVVVGERYADNPLLVLVDEKQIQEMILNLLNNAKDAISGKGTISIATYVKENLVRISIEDSGSGMSDEVLNKLFNPFFTTKDKGTGLGLSISQSIIKNNSGQLHFQSVPGVGTTAIISLPLRKRQA
ncbi:MAG: response regulator [Candidatus Omnitrophota bacterium]|nr:response regulator [Candidatus Omnitrophota bacterium]MBU1929372.1 response regulator [Candidatus Omnitrophota bacterium]MBU2035259.1 response regulator [Candidatus Omnitrophota bacterium]MBU2221842.1 response regulator [Candidatus Omnitrophota bacterium]MBU2257999.1 response regulator [Candidatus Omnitrophota bacterium]